MRKRSVGSSASMPTAPLSRTSLRGNPGPRSARPTPQRSTTSRCFRSNRCRKRLNRRARHRVPGVSLAHGRRGRRQVVERHSDGFERGGSVGAQYALASDELGEMHDVLGANGTLERGSALRPPLSARRSGASEHRARHTRRSPATLRAPARCAESRVPRRLSQIATARERVWQRASAPRKPVPADQAFTPEHAARLSVRRRARLLSRQGSLRSPPTSCHPQGPGRRERLRLLPAAADKPPRDR